nr:TIGR04282 family arsenosugar biosynthesis glycosyltransferase [Poseidonocella sp. HB161398]
MRPRLAVMVKEPRPGRVKTRLGAGIGMVPAAWWFRHQTRALLRRLRDPRWELVLAVSPDREGQESRAWPADLPRLPQGRGDLGARMGRILRQAPGPAIVIGADIPGITRAHVARAFHALAAHDAVIGPAPDGGYWLVGLAGRRAAPPGLFRGVRWSSAHARADTLRSMAGLRVATADTLADIDSAADLAALRHLGTGSAAR